MVSGAVAGRFEGREGFSGGVVVPRFGVVLVPGLEARVLVIACLIPF